MVLSSCGLANEKTRPPAQTSFTLAVDIVSSFLSPISSSPKKEAAASWAIPLGCFMVIKYPRAHFSTAELLSWQNLILGHAVALNSPEFYIKVQDCCVCYWTAAILLSQKWLHFTDAVRKELSFLQEVEFESSRAVSCKCFGIPWMKITAVIRESCGTLLVINSFHAI